MMMYVHNFKTKEDLIAKNFRWNRILEGYSLRFPVARYNGMPTLEGQITLFTEDGAVLPKIKLDVLSMNSDDYYFPFYVKSSVHTDFIRKIKKKISEKMKELGINKIIKINKEQQRR